MSDILNDAKKAFDDLKTKAEPVIEKAKAGAVDVYTKAKPVVEQTIEKAKDTVNDIKETIMPSTTVKEIKNEFFSGAEKDVRAAMDAVKSTADDMQAKLEALMYGKKEEDKTADEQFEDGNGDDGMNE